MEILVWIIATVLGAAVATCCLAIYESQKQRSERTIELLTEISSNVAHMCVMLERELTVKEGGDAESPPPKEGE